MEKAVTLYFVVLTPMDSAAISSSRTEMQARPGEELRKLRSRTRVPAVKRKSQFQLTNCGKKERPAAPFVISRFRKTTRMISAMPSVAMAR